MLPSSLQFPYQPPSGRGQGQLPFLPIKIFGESSYLLVDALLDSGSTTNVLPFSLGIRLGLDWEKAIPLTLAGNLARHQARAVRLSIQVREEALLESSFSWSSTDNVPVILGQTNFFQLYDVTFQGSQHRFTLLRQPDHTLTFCPVLP